MVFAVAVWMRLGGEREPLPDSGNVPAGGAGTAATAAVDASPEGGRIVADESAPPAATLRRQRYREILESLSPAGRPPSTAADTAAVPRAVVATAQNETIAPVRGTPTQAVPLSSSGSRVAERPSRRGEQAADRQLQEPQDRDSDTIPPRLLGAVFTPHEIRDGQSTRLALTVVDEFSGVRGVSGVISSPSGSIQGFAAQREGETDRYIAEINVPPAAAEGVWYVRHLTLIDRASNSVTLNYTDGSIPPTATFRVTSDASDTTGPVLKRVWLERPAMRARERNTVFVDAEDDKAGLAVVSGVFVSPARQARLGFGCRAGSTATWACTLNAPECLDCGLWQLEQVQLQDKAGNLATFRADDPLVAQVRLDISGDRCDAEPPVVSAFILEPQVISNAEGGQIRVQAIVEDPGCGVASLSGQAMPTGGVGGQRAYFSLQATADGRVFAGSIVIPKNAARGVWHVAWLQALDRGQNLRSYTAAEPVIGRATFRVD